MILIQLNIFQDVGVFNGCRRLHSTYYCCKPSISVKTRSANSVVRRDTIKKSKKIKIEEKFLSDFAIFTKRYSESAGVEQYYFCWILSRLICSVPIQTRILVSRNTIAEWYIWKKSEREKKPTLIGQISYKIHPDVLDPAPFAI